jgi:hypothetical protein
MKGKGEKTPFGGRDVVAISCSWGRMRQIVGSRLAGSLNHLTKSANSSRGVFSGVRERSHAGFRSQKLSRPQSGQKCSDL